jgi:hypothetical protein
MGLNNEFAHAGTPPEARRILVVDIETAALPDVELDAPEPNRTLKDPVKIAADLAAKTARQRAQMGLDWNAGRIVCIGTFDPVGTPATAMDVCADPGHERAALVRFWAVAWGAVLIGFRLRSFDLPYLIQRSRYLGVRPLDLPLSRYDKSGTVIDISDLLTFPEVQGHTAVVSQSLTAFARRAGIPVTDPTTGADVQGMVDRGDWDSIAAHCRADVETTVALARWLGVMAESEGKEE